jgi:hypothetical protein
MEIMSSNLPGETEEYHALGTLSCKASNFRERFRKVMNCTGFHSLWIVSTDGEDEETDTKFFSEKSNRLNGMIIIKCCIIS